MRASVSGVTVCREGMQVQPALSPSMALSTRDTEISDISSFEHSM